MSSTDLWFLQLFQNGISSKIQHFELNSMPSWSLKSLQRDRPSCRVDAIFVGYLGYLILIRIRDVRSFQQIHGKTIVPTIPYISKRPSE